MCGICGIFGNFDDRLISEKNIMEMLRSIYHRGPDDQGFFKDRGVMLGVRRLSVIDLKSGRQPMTNEDRTVWIAFNGEIYNFIELRRSLEKKGHIFTTQSDTEVILHLYEDYGVDCVNRLNGMFAFCIWDKKKSRIILAKDRFGMKPLYYTMMNDHIVFASELKSILCFPGIEKKIDFFALDNYLNLEYIPSPRTIFKNIYKLPAAHVLVYKDGNATVKRYWTLEVKNNIKFVDESNAKEILLTALKKSIKRHFISDVSLGVYLSGGIDSSSIVALAKKMFPGRLKTFSIGFEESSFDESKYSKKVSESFDTEHNHRFFSAKDIGHVLPNIIQMLDEPLADGSILPTYMLSKFSKEHVTVALSGDGADEIFAGYPTYQAHAFMEYYKKIPHFIRRKVIEKLINKIPTDHRNFSFDYIAKRFISGSNIDRPIDRHIFWMGAFDEDSKDCLYRRSLKDEIADTGSSNLQMDSLFNLGQEPDNLTLLQKFDISSYLENDILVKTDRASMMNSQEVRLPYLDHELVSLVFSLPSHLRLRGFRTKYILKQSMEKHLPKSIINRKKKGFGMPIALWMKSQLRDHIFDMMSASNIKKQGLFNYKYVNRLLEDHLTNKVDNRKKIWTLFMFEAWYNQHMK